MSAYVEWYGKERRQNWGTPRALFDQLNAKYAFTLDGASAQPHNALADARGIRDALAVAA